MGPTVHHDPHPAGPAVRADPHRADAAVRADAHPADPAVRADPPIYRDLLRLWASRGQTLPGRRDPEWSRLAAPAAWDGRLSASRARRGDGR
ncbi:hypothetical protein ACFQ60_12120 [Streptomyces zhihengii]